MSLSSRAALPELLSARWRGTFLLFKALLFVAYQKELPLIALHVISKQSYSKEKWDPPGDGVLCI